VLLIDEVYLIEYIPRILQADAVFSLDVPALLSVELEPHGRIYLLYHRPVRSQSRRDTSRPPGAVLLERAVGRMVLHREHNTG
jgi:hypothetical protein